MGRDDDSSAVVNMKGLVRGIERLRIVDASVFPLLPPGHPQATVCECSAPCESALKMTDSLRQMRWQKDSLRKFWGREGRSKKNCWDN